MTLQACILWLFLMQTEIANFRSSISDRNPNRELFRLTALHMHTATAPKGPYRSSLVVYDA